MKLITRFFALFTALLMSSMLFAQSNRFSIEIKENKGPCTGVAEQSCYLVRYHNSKDWENFYAPLANFNYQEGYRYRVLVQRTKRKNVPADASAYTYRVVRVQQKRKMNDATVGRGRVLVVEVKESLVDCIGEVPMKCMQVKFPGKQEWNYFYSQIEGFTYEEGYRYKLKIRETDRVNVPADASSKRYELIRLLSKRKVDKSKAAVENEARALAFLEKHSWRLIQLNGKNLDENSVLLNFDAKASRVFGNAGCNNFGGSVKIKDEHIAFTQVAITERACLHATVEKELLQILGAADLRFDIADQTFNLYQDTKLVAMFAFVPKVK